MFEIVALNWCQFVKYLSKWDSSVSAELSVCVQVVGDILRARSDVKVKNLINEANIASFPENRKGSSTFRS